MSDLHDLQARAGDFERAIAETKDQPGSLLSGLESGLNQLRERLVGATAANDRLLRENTELRAIVEQLLGALENKPAETLHDKLAALDGQIHGLLELSGVQAPGNGTPVAAGDDNGASSKCRSEADSDSGGGPFEEIRDRMRALSSQLLAPASASVTPEAPGSAAARDPEPPSRPFIDAFPKSLPDRHARRESDTPSAFERPIRALTEKAQSVLPKVRHRFDAETDYALSILRRLRGGRQAFGIEEVRELINGKFGLTLTDRDDAQLSASLANQEGLTRGPGGGNSNNAPSWRFETG
jgi:hypothetical protein